MKQPDNARLEIKQIYFVDFAPGHELIKKEDAFFITSDSIKAPMGGNIAAFSSKEKMNEVSKEFNAKQATWNELKM
jgi:copper chaperone NosL